MLSRLAVATFLAASLLPPLTSAARADQDSEEKQPTVRQVVLRLLSVRQRPDGTWVGTTEWKFPHPVVEGGRGTFYRWFAIGSDGNFPKPHRLLGQARVLTVVGTTVTVVLTPLSAGPDNAPKQDDLLKIPVRLDPSLYDGIILATALNRIYLTDGEQKTRYTSLEEAMAVRSAADELALLEKMAAEVRARFAFWGKGDRPFDIGVRIRVEESRVLLEPQPGLPAAQTGILPGDQVLQLDGKPVKRIEDVNTRAADPGEVRLTIARQGLQNPIEVVVPRAEVPPQWRYSNNVEVSNLGGRTYGEVISSCNVEGIRQMLIALNASPGRYSGRLGGVFAFYGMYLLQNVLAPKVELASSAVAAEEKATHSLDVFTRVTQAGLSDDGEWLARIDLGAEEGLAKEVRGRFEKTSESGSDQMAGFATVVEVSTESAILKVVPRPGLESFSVAVGDYINVPLQIRADVYNGMVLRAAAAGVVFKNSAMTAEELNLRAALALRSAAAEEEFLDGLLVKGKEAVQRSQAPVLEKVIESGPSRGQTLRQAVMTANAESFRTFLEYVSSFSLAYRGKDYPFFDSFAGWLSIGAPEARDTVIRRATSIEEEADLRAYLEKSADLVHLRENLTYFFFTAVNAADAKQEARARQLIRLLTVLEKVTAIPAFGVAAQIAEGWLLRALDRPSEAVASLRAAAAQADRLDDSPAQAAKENGDASRTLWKAYALNRLAWALGGQSDYAAAAAASDEVRELFQSKARSMTRVAVGTAALEYSAQMYRRAGNFRLAEERYAEAVARAPERSDQIGREREVRLLNEWAEVASERQNYGLAIQRREKARALANRYGFQEKALDYTWSLANDYWNAGEYETARGLFDEILPVYLERKDHANTCVILRNIGGLISSLGNFEAARAILSEALEMAARESLTRCAIWVRRSMGESLRGQRRFDEAAREYEQAVTLASEDKDRDLKALLLSDRGEMYLQMQRPAEAGPYFRRAAEIFLTLRDLAESRRQRARLAEVHLSLGAPREAERILKEVIGEQEKAQDEGGLLRSRTTLARLYLRSLGDLPAAKRELDEALSLAEALRDFSQKFYLRANLAGYYFTIGAQREGQRVVQESLEEARANNDELAAAGFAHQLADISLELNDLARGREYYREVLQYCERRNLKIWAANVVLSLAYIDLWEGDLPQARQWLDFSREYVADSEDEGVRMRRGMFLARLQHKIGEYRQTIETLREVRQLAAKNSNWWGELQALASIGRIQMEQSEYVSAQATWEELLRRAAGYVDYELQAYAYLAQVWTATGEFEKAQVAARKSVEIADSLGVTVHEPASTRAILGLLLLTQARLTNDLELRVRSVDEATALLNEAETRARQHHLEHVLLMTQFGWLRRKLLLAERPIETAVAPLDAPAGEPPEEVAVNLARKLLEKRIQWESLFLRGSLRAKQGDMERAVADLLASVDVLEKEAQNYAALAAPGASVAGFYQADKTRPFLELVNLYGTLAEDFERERRQLEARGMAQVAAASRQRADEAYQQARDTLDRLRRFEILTTSSGVLRPADSEPVQQAAAEYQHLIRQEMDLERRIAEERKKGREPVVNTLMEALKVQQGKIDAQANLISRQYPDLASRLELKVTGLGSFADRLGEDEALLQPVLLPGRLVVFVVRNQNRRSRVRSFSHALDEEEFKIQLEQLWLAASNPKSEFDSAAAAAAGSPARIAAELYDRLLAPAEPALSGVRTILISATGKMRYVPFHLLLAPAGEGRRRFTNELYDFVYLTRSGTLGRYEEKPAFRGAPIVAVANPDETLPEADQEVTQIEATWKAATPEAPIQLKRHRQAGVREVDSSLQKVAAGDDRNGIFHLATHGKAGLLASESYLVFADGRVTQDRLKSTFTDLSGIRLVVLSACETALGSMDELGNGVTGLAYEFEESGVKTVVATLWKLHSEAGSRFMDVFYRELAGGKSVAQAMKEARETIRNTPRQSHPYYWAPFILIGQWR